jgi:hypothetical protein
LPGSFVASHIVKTAIAKEGTGLTRTFGCASPAAIGSAARSIKLVEVVKSRAKGCGSVMKKALVILTMCLFSASARAQLVISEPNLPTVVSFSGFNGSGFAPDPTAGQLDSDSWASTGWSDGDLAFGETRTTGDYARGSSTGGVTTGGIYAFTVQAGNVALGLQPATGDWAPGTLTLRISNQSGASISQLDIAYEVWVRNDQGRASSFSFSYSPDGSSFTNFPTADVTSAATADASPAWVLTDRVISITDLNLANFGQFYLRWSGNDLSGIGSRDEFALDNISVSPFIIAKRKNPQLVSE